MKASHRRVLRALEDGARIEEYVYRSEVRRVPVLLSGVELFRVTRAVLDEMAQHGKLKIRKTYGAPVKIEWLPR